MHIINQCNLSGNRTSNRSMPGNPPCLCGHSGRIGLKLTLMTACCSLVHAVCTTTCRVHYCAQAAPHIRCTLLRSRSPSIVCNTACRVHALLGTEYMLCVLLLSISLYYCVLCAQLRADPVHFVDWCMRCALLRVVPRPSTAPGVGVDK